MRSSSGSNAWVLNAGNKWSNTLLIRPVFYFEGLELGIVDFLHLRRECGIFRSNIDITAASVLSPTSTFLLLTLARAGFANGVKDLALLENGRKNSCLVQRAPPLRAQLADGLTMLPQTDGRQSQVAVRHLPVMALLILP